MIHRYDSSTRPPSLVSSGAILIIANLVPLVGAVWFGWDVFDIVLTYWFENLVIGFITILRIATVRKREGADSILFRKILMIPFFMIHYGGFCIGHGAFIGHMLGREREVSPEDLDSGGGMGLWVAVLALFISHLFSFFRNYIGRGEFKRAILEFQMFAPYPRIVVLHLAIMFGAMAAERAGETTTLLVSLVIGKIIIDLGIHLLAHLKNQFMEMKTS